MPQVKVFKGHIVPTTATVRNVVKDIRTEAQSNPVLLQELKSNPRQFLGSRGIPIDSQRELLRDDGFDLTKVGLNAMDCTVTCITTECCCTSCCFTSWW